MITSVMLQASKAVAMHIHSHACNMWYKYACWVKDCTCPAYVIHVLSQICAEAAAFAAAICSKYVWRWRLLLVIDMLGQDQQDMQQ